MPKNPEKSINFKCQPLTDNPQVKVDFKVKPGGVCVDCPEIITQEGCLECGLTRRLCPRCG